MSLALYLDEDSSARLLVRALRQLRVNVSVPSEVGMLLRTDEEQMEYAAAHGHVLVSGNIGDFRALHYAWLSVGKTHSGLILVEQQKFSIGERVRTLHFLADTLSAEEMANRAEFLSSWR